MAGSEAHAVLPGARLMFRSITCSLQLLASPISSHEIGALLCTFRPHNAWCPLFGLVLCFVMICMHWPHLCFHKWGKLPRTPLPLPPGRASSSPLKTPTPSSDIHLEPFKEPSGSAALSQNLLQISQSPESEVGEMEARMSALHNEHSSLLALVVCSNSRLIGPWRHQWQPPYSLGPQMPAIWVIACLTSTLPSTSRLPQLLDPSACSPNPARHGVSAAVPGEWLQVRVNS